jgi:hypothetical protein
MYSAGPFSLVIFHSVSSVFVILIFLNRWLKPRPIPALGLAAIVFGASRLPWVNSLLMPDVFGGLGPAAVLILMIGRFTLSLPERVFLIAVIAVSLLSQTSSLAIVPLSAMAIALIGWYVGVQIQSFRAITIVCTICILAVGVMNTAKHGQFTLNPSGPAAIFAKFSDVGLAQQYLLENCAHTHYKICERLSALDKLAGPPPDPSMWDTQRFLWESIDGGPALADQLDAWRDPDHEFRKLVFRLILAYPLEFGRIAMVDSFNLLMRVGEHFSKYRGSWGLDPWTAKFEQAKQQTGAMLQRPFNQIYEILYLLALLGLIIASFATSKLSRCLAAATISIAFINAFIHGALVCACARYQDKVSWLTTLSLITVGYLEFTAIRKRAPAPAAAAESPRGRK